MILIFLFIDLFIIEEILVGFIYNLTKGSFLSFVKLGNFVSVFVVKYVESLYWGVEVKSGKGTTEPKLVQTGSTNYGYVAVAGVVLIAGIALVVARKNAVRANA